MSKQPWCHIHGHSMYSQKDAIGGPDEIVETAAKRGFESICITDHGTLSGWFDHYEACKKHGIKGLFGIEAYVAPKSRLDKGVTKEDEASFEKIYGRKILSEEKKAIQKYRKQAMHLVLLAQNDEGIKNLYKIATDANENGYYYFPKTDWDFLDDHSEGIIATTACGNGVLAKPLRSGDDDLLAHSLFNFHRVFEDRGFLELQLTDWEDQMMVNKKMLEISRQYNMPIVVTQDFHYPNPEDDFARNYMKKIAYDQTVEDLDDWNRSSEHTMHICTYEQAQGFWGKFGYADAFGWQVLDEGFANTKYIESQINGEPDFSSRKFPAFITPEGFSNPVEYLNSCVQSGWQHRLPQMGKAPGNVTVQEYSERLSHELKTVSEMGFIDYFLIVADFNLWAKNNGLACGPARGSAGGCLLSWILGITEIDPLRWGLSFERFLNAKRLKPPDIDLDYSDVDRHIVKEYLVKKWGSSNVAEIGAYARFKQRLMFRDICRVHRPTGDRDSAIYNKQVNILGKTLDNDKNFAANVQGNRPLGQFLSDNQIGNIAPVMDRLNHHVHHTTRSAAGMIISDRPISDWTSLRRLKNAKEKKEYLVTEIEGDKLVDAGFLKMDILGITDLRILKDAGNKVDYIREYNEKAGYELAWFYEECSFDDPNVWEAFQKGDTFACFQMGGHFITELAKKVRPNSIDELAVISALDRPQQISLGYPERFWRRKHGLEAVESVHPFIDDILQPTYGLLVYQEQFINILNKLGLEYGDADILRRLCEDIVKPTKRDRAKPKYDKIMADLLSKEPPPGITKAEVKQIVEQVGSTVGYSFNRSHSLAYSLIAYFDQYMKVYHPMEFWEGMLNGELTASSSKDLNYPLARLNQAAKQTGKELVTVTGTINSWCPLFKVVYGDDQTPYLYFAISKADKLGMSTLEKLIKYYEDHGPFTYIGDFFDKKKLKGTGINKAHQLKLIQIGLFDNMPLCSENPIILNRNQLIFWQDEFAVTTKTKLTLLLDEYVPDSEVTFLQKDQTALEVEVFDMMVTHNPFGVFNDIQKRLDDVSEKTGKKAVVGAVIGADRKKFSTVLKVTTGADTRELAVLDRDFKKTMDIHLGVPYIFEIEEDEQYKTPRIVKIVPYSVEDTTPKVYGNA